MAAASAPRLPSIHPSRTLLRLRFGRMARPAGLCLLMALAGCVTDRTDVTGSISPTATPKNDADLRATASTWGDRYRANPSDKTAALKYAHALRGLTQYEQATAVLETAAIKSPYDAEVLGAYGKALADTGKFKQAAEVLSRAQSPENPNWTILSAQGSVADQMGDHAEAQAFYTTALKIKPGDPSVLSNLGLSYALSNKLPLAEATMRQAAASPDADMRVRQNLALVLALEGRFGEAEQIAQVDLSPTDAAASVASIRAMIAQSNTWRDIQRSGTTGTGGGRLSAKVKAIKSAEAN